MTPTERRQRAEPQAVRLLDQIREKLGDRFSEDGGWRECLTLLADALAQVERETRIGTLSDAQHRGYLDHREDCRKGRDSETCTCGMMTWLVEEPNRRATQEKP